MTLEDRVKSLEEEHDLLVKLVEDEHELIMMLSACIRYITGDEEGDELLS